MESWKATDGRLPDYDAAQLHELEAQADAILDAFAGRGYAREEPSVLQPADIFLDRSGEEIRRRTFTLTDPSGRELCLRPDLTIPDLPACRSKAASPIPRGSATTAWPSAISRPSRIARRSSSRPASNCSGSRIAPPAKPKSCALDGRGPARRGPERFRHEDRRSGLFGALVDALDVPAQWRGRLKRHFWRAGYFEALLHRLTTGAASDAQRLLAHLGGLEPKDARAAIEGLLDMVGEAPLGARTREEIVERADRAGGGCGGAAARSRRSPHVITGLLAVSGPGAGGARAKSVR